MDKAEALRELFGLPKDEAGYVNILTYRGTIYGVYEHYEDAYKAGVQMFGESALSFLDANIIRKQVQ